MEKTLIIIKIKELEKSIVKLLFNENDIKCKNITPTQVRVINYILKSKTPVYQKDLEKFLGITRATTSGVLKTMEKHGLIEKLPNQHDARSKEIVLNKKTKDIFKSAQEKIEKIEKILISDINNEKLDIFLEVINKMNSNIKNYK